MANSTPQYERSGNSPAQRWAWNLLLAAIFKKNQVTLVLSRVKFSQAAFHGTAGCFHLQDMSKSSLQHFTWTPSLWNQHHFSTTAISDMGHWWVLHHSQHSACYSFLHPAVLNTCCFTPPPMGEQRQQREGQFSAPDAASKPQTGLWKRIFAALGAFAGVRLRWFSVLREGLVGIGTPRQATQQGPPMAQPEALPPECASTSWGFAGPRALKGSIRASV